MPPKTGIMKQCCLRVRYIFEIYHSFKTDDRFFSHVYFKKTHEDGIISNFIMDKRKVLKVELLTHRGLGA